MKTIETCKTIEKQSYFYGKPKITDGKCYGYISGKSPHDLLAVCRKCKLLYKEGEHDKA